METWTLCKLSFVKWTSETLSERTVHDGILHFRSRFFEMELVLKQHLGSTFTERHQIKWMIRMTFWCAMETWYVILYAGIISLISSSLKITFSKNRCDIFYTQFVISRALQLPPNAWLRFSINHASITWLSITPNGKVSLKEYSDVGHMPPDLITTTWEVLENVTLSGIWGGFLLLY